MMHNLTTLFIAILVALLVTLIIVFFISTYKRRLMQKEYVIKVLMYKNQHELFNAQSQAEEKEKERIAKNLHDEINPMLTVLNQNLQKHKFNIVKNKFDINDFENDHILIEKISEGIRCSSYDLVPSFLLKFGLIAALEDYVRILNQDDLIASFNLLTEKKNELLISKADQLSVYRMSLEIINNILKHSFCSKIELSFSALEQYFSIEIRHNGTVVTNEQMDNYMNKSIGLGLKSVKARSLLLNANINYTTQDNYALVNLTIPIKL